MISKSLSTSRRFARLAVDAGPLGEFAQSLFPLVVAHADDFGRLSGDAFTVKHLCHPTSKRSVTQFDTALGVMEKVGLIARSDEGGINRIQVNSFEEHQVGLHKRSSSKFPEVPGNSGGFPLNLTKGKGTEGKRTEQENGGAPPRPENRTYQKTPIVPPNGHIKHAACDPTFSRCVPAHMHHKFIDALAPKHGGDRDLSRRALEVWYPTIWAALSDDFVMGDALKFWQAKFDEHFASATPKKANRLTEDAATMDAGVVKILRDQGVIL